MAMKLIKRILHEDANGTLYVIEWWKHSTILTKVIRRA